MLGVVFSQLRSFETAKQLKRLSQLGLDTRNHIIFLTCHAELYVGDAHIFGETSSIITFHLMSMNQEMLGILLTINLYLHSLKQYFQIMYYETADLKIDFRI